MNSLTPQQEPESRRYELDPVEPRDDYPQRGYEPIHPKGRVRELGKKLWAPIAGLGYLIFKFKAAALAIFKLKIFVTSATMLVSIAAYAWIFTWRFAIGFVLLILVHELGHVVELRRQNIAVSGLVFIPFLGAAVGSKTPTKNAWMDARVALAGPIAGTLGGAAVWAAAEALDSDLFMALAFTTFFLNLINLIPVIPLDGGRAIAALHPAFLVVGFAVFLGLTILWPNPISFLVLLVGGLDLWRRWRNRDETREHDESFYAIAPWQRAVVGLTYFGLAGLLALAMSATHIERTF